MIALKNTLFLIMARGGSKGVPNKNIKLLNDKPLIYYSIDHARNFVNNENICVSTDSIKIKTLVENYGLEVPFFRPAKLALDNSDSYDVMIHAIEYYKKLNVFYDTIVVLQPTSPLRQFTDIEKALELYDDKIDMVVSVKISKSNPYYNLFEEDKKGYLKKFKNKFFANRQECPTIYEYNGAIYVINAKQIIKNHTSKLKKIKKIVMNEYSSIDIDTELDFLLAELILKNNLI